LTTIFGGENIFSTLSLVFEWRGARPRPTLKNKGKVFTTKNYSPTCPVLRSSHELEICLKAKKIKYKNVLYKKGEKS